jgi:alpha-glucosidase
VLSNHDVTRHVTRYGREDTTFSFATNLDGTPVDLELGTRRGRAAALLSLSLPGAAYVYQGEELGLWENENIPVELLQDPMWARKGHSRDGCRVPLPWSGADQPFGFSPADPADIGDPADPADLGDPADPADLGGPTGLGGAAVPWLPQPAEWKDRTVQAQTGDPNSMLELYRSAIRLRRAESGLHQAAMTWLPSAAGVLAYRRGDDFACVVNMSGGEIELPPFQACLLASGPIHPRNNRRSNDGVLLPPDTAVWLRLSTDG